ncbi:hypothetical protein ZPR_4410 [Zunongwangia profunda SM-A87]|uniref:Uncharacterized protein n=1 Tax=Zunongwangia profunda (strain DSM 18752 / CCTCC AB 206139 / SM-A87) TaxID=655815 RepID=D5BC86_ZUNPS|nr:hypothetical protein ZPR_4410 [Zunongwangia profunda SM-A87]
MEREVIKAILFYKHSLLFEVRSIMKFSITTSFYNGVFFSYV